MVDAFVIGNLYGAGVATGQSAFKPEDFRARKRVLRDDLRLTVDPTLPYSSGSYRITSEGVPARRQAYIDRGRLLRPIVGLKYARRLGVEPSTPPTSMESIRLEAAGGALDRRRALAALGEGLLVLSALGVHTQDASSGDYSLTAPQAVVVRDGRPRGSVKAVIAGNFLEALRDPATSLVEFEGYRFPGLLLTSSVTVGR
jgi:PmbA protein